MNRVCSECGTSLADKRLGTKTCSAKCRKDRSRRLARKTREATEAKSHDPLAHAVAEELNHRGPESVARKVVAEELRPVVREAITEDVMRALRDMVNLTPEAVQVLGEQLRSDDEGLRHKAASLVTRYTLGHPALVTPEETEGRQIIVHFGLPRPGDDGSAVEVEAEVLKTCDVCGKEKPESEFVANSDRCQSCFEEQRQLVMERFGS